ncbi:hypothetical protein FGO68_gene7868 [Halteria grandinella]|uniref:Uncharacterized protein n=1 Tax=Halteria grandinella TaxID=5974 RepID=A0A8J8T1A9_HALGN|nr:hypothetical protein FGO68_gene7868 [Halteria grandinella]
MKTLTLKKTSYQQQSLTPQIVQTTPHKRILVLKRNSGKPNVELGEYSSREDSKDRGEVISLKDIIQGKDTSDSYSRTKLIFQLKNHISHLIRQNQQARSQSVKKNETLPDFELNSSIVKLEPNRTSSQLRYLQQHHKRNLNTLTTKVDRSVEPEPEPSDVSYRMQRANHVIPLLTINRLQVCQFDSDSQGSSKSNRRSTAFDVKVKVKISQNLRKRHKPNVDLNDQLRRINISKTPILTSKQLFKKLKIIQQ